MLELLFHWEKEKKKASDFFLQASAFQKLSGERMMVEVKKAGRQMVTLRKGKLIMPDLTFVFRVPAQRSWR